MKKWRMEKIIFTTACSSWAVAVGGVGAYCICGRDSFLKGCLMGTEVSWSHLTIFSSRG